MFGQERENQACDFVVLLIEGEMPSVEQMNLCVR
jgi:hypothetical protein